MKNGTTNKAYLAFYYPDECELHEGMPFNCAILEVKTDFSRVDKLVDKAYSILNGEIPESEEAHQKVRDFVIQNFS